MITANQHPKEIILYGSATLLERAAYYGIRTLIVLFMIGETLNMERGEALQVYGWFTGILTITALIGAVLGDILLGNKTAIFIGGILQALGAFVLCSNSEIGLYVGIGFIALGTGLYKFNMLSQIGKLYYKKAALSDAGYTIYYLVLNLGAFLGIFAIGALGESAGFQYGFLLAGILLLLSSCIIFFTPKKATEVQAYYKENKAKINVVAGSLLIFSVSIAIALYWYMAGVSAETIYMNRYDMTELAVVSWPRVLWDSFNMIFLFFFGIILIIAWSFLRRSSRLIKLAIGFVFLAFSFVLLYYLNESSELSQTTAILLVVVLCFQSISELFVGPIVNALVSRFSNPKFLATIFSLVFLPMNVLVTLLTGMDIFDGNMSIALITFIVLGFLIGGVFLVAFLLKKTVKIR